MADEEGGVDVMQEEGCGYASWVLWIMLWPCFAGVEQEVRLDFWPDRPVDVLFDVRALPLGVLGICDAVMPRGVAVLQRGNHAFTVML